MKKVIFLSACVLLGIFSAILFNPLSNGQIVNLNVSELSKNAIKQPTDNTSENQGTPSTDENGTDIRNRGSGRNTEFNPIDQTSDIYRKTNQTNEPTNGADETVDNRVTIGNYREASQTESKESLYSESNGVYKPAFVRCNGFNDLTNFRISPTIDHSTRDNLGNDSLVIAQLECNERLIVFPNRVVSNSDGTWIAGNYQGQQGWIIKDFIEF